MSITEFLFDVSAVRDGITFMGIIQQLDGDGHAVGNPQYVDGIVADTEEEAIDRIIEQIRARFPDEQETPQI